jgi:hypothetical protein
MSQPKNHFRGLPRKDRANQTECFDRVSGGKRMNIKRFAIGAAAAMTICGTAQHLASANRGAEPQENEKINHTSLKPGDMAPDFTLLDNNWKKVHLSDYRGKKNVVLAFYVLAFTGG